MRILTVHASRVPLTYAHDEYSAQLLLLYSICTCLRHPTQADVHVDQQMAIQWPRKQKMALSYHRCYATLRGVIRMRIDAESARCRRILKRVYGIERKILMTRHLIAYSEYSLSGCASDNYWRECNNQHDIVFQRDKDIDTTFWRYGLERTSC